MLILKITCRLYLLLITSIFSYAAGRDGSGSKKFLDGKSEHVITILNRLELAATVGAIYFSPEIVKGVDEIEVTQF